MGTTLATLAPPKGAKHKRKRKGRGPGSGNGTTAGKGQKGQKSRSGGKTTVGFEGGQMPLQRRVPKRGFKNPFRIDYYAINVGRIAEVFKAGESVTPETLSDRGLVPRSSKLIKILGEGDVGHALDVQAHSFSASAKSKLEAAGGKAAVIETRVKNVGPKGSKRYQAKPGDAPEAAQGE
ncbi:MAG: 50S ribosomal protein L15 [Myxococcales bacterium]|nr:50S ribosomal protein L15 [Myxococcales bacterium]